MPTTLEVKAAQGGKAAPLVLGCLQIHFTRKFLPTQLGWGICCCNQSVYVHTYERSLRAVASTLTSAILQPYQVVQTGWSF
jgi:hypothetical protein